GRAILYNVRVAMWNHHDVPGLQCHTIAVFQPGRGASLGKQVINDHVFSARCKIAGEPARGRRINTPWRGKFAVVKQRSLEFHYLQDFGKHIHTTLPRTPGKPFRTLEQANHTPTASRAREPDARIRPCQTSSP